MMYEDVMMMYAQLGLKKTRSGAATYCTLTSSNLARFFPSNNSNSFRQCPEGPPMEPRRSLVCTRSKNLRWSVEVDEEDHPVYMRYTS